MKKHSVILIELFIGALMFSGCSDKKPDPQIALELVRVMFYDERPRMELADIQRSGLQIEDYLPTIKRYSPEGDKLQIRMVYASTLLKWGKEEDAQELLQREPRGMDAEDDQFWLDLKFGASLFARHNARIDNATKIEESAWHAPLETEAVGDLWDGDPRHAIEEFSAYLLTNGWNRHMLDRATMVIRASAKYAKDANVVGPQRELSQTALDYILGGKSWEDFLRIQGGDNGSVANSIYLSDLVWILGSRMQIERLARKDDAVLVWNQKINDVIALFERSGDRRAKWVKYVKDDYFSQ